MKKNVSLLLGAVLLLATTAPVLAQDKPPVTAKPAVPDYPVIGHIEKRDRTITIKAGAKGPLYTVQTAQGKVLFENLSGEQLRAQAPELHQFLRTAVAAQKNQKEAVVDASIHSTHSALR